MLQVKNGDQVLSGILKTPTGALIVDDKESLNKYKRERDLYMRLAALEKQVAILSELIQEKNNG